jgi:hypothetical protein
MDPEEAAVGIATDVPAVGRDDVAGVHDELDAGDLAVVRANGRIGPPTEDGDGLVVDALPVGTGRWTWSRRWCGCRRTVGRSTVEQGADGDRRGERAIFQGAIGNESDPVVEGR